jgi:hypothetical protein
MMNSWLTDTGNQASFYTICRSAVTEVAPEEEPILEELFPRFVELTETGDVKVGTHTSEAFGFAGDSELVTIIIIPVLFQVVSALLVKYGLARIAELKRADLEESEHNVTSEEIRYQVEQELGSTVRNPSQRRQIAKTATNSLIDYLERE